MHGIIVAGVVLALASPSLQATIKCKTGDSTTCDATSGICYSAKIKTPGIHTLTDATDKAEADKLVTELKDKEVLGCVPDDKKVKFSDYTIDMSTTALADKYKDKCESVTTAVFSKTLASKNTLTLTKSSIDFSTCTVANCNTKQQGDCTTFKAPTTSTLIKCKTGATTTCDGSKCYVGKIANPGSIKGTLSTALDTVALEEIKTLTNKVIMGCLTNNKIVIEGYTIDISSNEADFKDKCKAVTTATFSKSITSGTEKADLVLEKSNIGFYTCTVANCNVDSKPTCGVAASTPTTATTAATTSGASSFVATGVIGLFAVLALF